MGQTQIPGTPGIRDYTIQLRDIDPGLVFPWSMVSKTGAVPSDIGAVGSNNPVFTGHVTVPTPVLPSDAATKNYVDLLANSAGGSLTFQSATQDPPYMPQVGQSWIVPVGATFPDWIGHDASIATLRTTGWAFTQPGTASFGYVIDEGGYFEYDIVHGAWQKIATWPLSYGVKDSFLETMSVPLFIASTASAVNQYNQAHFYGSFVEINIPDSTNFSGYSFANASTSLLNISGTLPALQATATQSTVFLRDGASNNSYETLVCHQAAALLGGTNTSVGSFHGQEIIFRPFGPGSHIADITGLYFQLFPFTSDSSVDVAQGVHITSPYLAYGPSYQIGTLYGVRIDDQTVASTATKSYNLYSFGRNSNNVFEGNVTTGPLSVSQASQYFTRIQPPDPPMVSVSGPGVLSGVYNWGLSYLTDRGETEVLVPLNFQNLVLSNNSASVPIPIWPSPAVSSVRVWRTTGTNPGYALQLVATITDNSVRNYMDNVPDSSLGQFATVYNSTGGEIYVDGLRYFSSSVSGGISLGPYSGSLQGYNNVNLGTFTGSAQTTAHGEVNVGNYAGSAATTAAGNTNVGMSAGYSNIDGHRNVNIGLNTGFSNQHGWRNINIGEWMGFDETGSDMFHLGTSTRELMTGNLSAGTLQIDTPAGFSVSGPLSCTGMATAPILRVTTGSASGNVLTDIDGLGTAAWQPLTAASVGLGNVLNLTQITGATNSTLTQTDTKLSINLDNMNTWTTMQTFSGGLTGTLSGTASGNIPMVTPGASGNVLTSNGSAWTSAAPPVTTPAGTGSELQYRAGASTFGAVAGSSVSGGAITLTAPSPSTVPLTVKGASGQTASIAEWRNSAGTLLAQIRTSSEIYSAFDFIAPGFQEDQLNGILYAGNHGNVVNIRNPINLNGSGYWGLDNSMISGTVTRLVSGSDYDTDLKLTVNHNASNQRVIYGTSGVTPTLALNPDGGNVGIGTPTPTSPLQVVGLPVYASNAAAIAGGLTAGAFYRTGGDPDLVCVVH